MGKGGTDWKMLLIAGMAVVIVILVAIVLGGERKGEPEEPVTTAESAPGSTRQVETEAPDLPLPADIIRIRKAEGNTYRTSIVGQVKGEALNKDWGFRVVTHYLYRWELLYDSEILKNDGRTIEEERRFLTAHEYRIVSPREFHMSTGWLLTIEGVGWVFGARGVGAMVTAGETGLNKILGGPAVEEMTVRWKPHSIEGKKATLRLPDTMRSTDVEVSGELTQEDRDILRNMSLLLDARTLPKEDMKEGETWTVDASELAVALDPGLDGKVVGTLRLARLEDEEATAGVIAPLRMNLDATLRDRGRGNAVQGRFMADGEGRFNKEEGILETAELIGKATYEELSTDHLLFEARHEYRPELEIQFKCYNLSDPDVINVRGQTLDMEQFRREAPKGIRELMEQGT